MPTEEFDAIRCEPVGDGRHEECDLIYRHTPVETVQVEEVTVRDMGGTNEVVRFNHKAYSGGRYTLSFDEPVRGEIGAQRSYLGIEI